MRKEILKLLKEKADKALLKPVEERTYEERFNIWDYEHFKNLGNTSKTYDEGEEVFIYDGEKLANDEIKDGFGNSFPDWFREVGKHFNQKVVMDDGNEYTLLGMSYTYLDYYYIVQNSEGKKIGWSCVGSIKYL